MNDSTKNIDAMIDSLTDEDKAALFSQVPSGLSALMQIVAAVEGTPLEGWVNERVVEIALALIGKMAALNQFGGSMKFDELESVVDSYHGAMSGVPEHSRMTGTINAAAEELGSVADKYIKRHLITALDTSKLNREAYMDILHGHAMMTRGILGLTDVEGLDEPSEDDAEPVSFS